MRWILFTHNYTPMQSPKPPPLSSSKTNENNNSDTTPAEPTSYINISSNQPQTDICHHHTPTLSNTSPPSFFQKPHSFPPNSHHLPLNQHTSLQQLMSQSASPPHHIPQPDHRSPITWRRWIPTSLTPPSVFPSTAHTIESHHKPFRNWTIQRHRTPPRLFCMSKLDSPILRNYLGMTRRCICWIIDNCHRCPVYGRSGRPDDVGEET